MSKPIEREPSEYPHCLTDFPAPVTRQRAQSAEPAFGDLLKNLQGHAAQQIKGKSGHPGKIESNVKRDSKRYDSPRAKTSPGMTGAIPVSRKPPDDSNWRARGSSGLATRSVSVGPLGTRIELSAPPEDLLRDQFIMNARRMEFEGRTVPSLGGIPLLRKIGQGGMGAVYYGVHCGFAREVAVKVLPFHLATRDTTTVERFFREARLSIGVTSEHVVSVMDVAEEEGIFYLVMEYVSGRTAGQLVKQAKLGGEVGLKERSVLEICIAACEGLKAAHAQNIIHRDIKPDNILLPIKKGQSAVTYTGAKLADLGLARDEELGQSMTGANACLGTPGFMAPEQVENAHEASKPADVFGMGATLYALLSGEPPFAGETFMSIMRDTMDTPHRPIRAIRPDVSKATAMVLDLCLAKKSEHRYEDADALLRALRACLAGLIDPQSVQYLDINRPIIKRDSLEPAFVARQISYPARPSKFSLKWIAGAALFVFSAGIAAAYQWSSSPSDFKQHHVSIATPTQLDEEEQSRDKKLEEIDRIKKFDLQSSQRKLATLAQTHEAAVLLAKTKADNLKFEYDDSIKQAVGLMDKKDWSQAEIHLTKAVTSPVHASSNRSDAINKLLAQVKISLARDSAAKESVTLRKQLIERIRREPVDQFGRCAFLSSAAREEIQRNTVALNNLHVGAPDQELLDVLKRLNTHVSLDTGSAEKIELVLVPPGEFTMGNKQWAAGTGAEYEHSVPITSGFYLSTTPITVGQFRRFAESTHALTDAERDDGRLGKGGNGLRDHKIGWVSEMNWKQPGFNQQEDHPVVCVTFSDCLKYCNWLSTKIGHRVRLPSEAEWEYAARGNTGNQWPWGNTWDGKRCNYADSSLQSVGIKMAQANSEAESDGFIYTSPAGMFDNSSWCDARDMAGNVSQWCADWYSTLAYTQSTESNSSSPDNGELIPFGLFKEAVPCRVIRGGSFLDNSDMQRSTARKKAPELWRSIDLGFRIVIVPIVKSN